MRATIQNFITNFKPYSYLWEDWCDEPCCNFTSKEIFLIIIYSDTKFQNLALKNFKNSSFPIETLKRLNQRLVEELPEFKKWAITYLHVSLISFKVNNSSQKKISTFLQLFGLEKLNDFYNVYPECILKKPLHFENVCLGIKILNPGINHKENREEVLT